MSNLEPQDLLTPPPSYQRTCDCNSLTAELARIGADRDSWQRTCQRVTAERDALAAELAACQARCERLQTELDQQVSENAALLRWLTPSQLRQALERKRKHEANGDLAAPAGEEK